MTISECQRAGVGKTCHGGGTESDKLSCKCGSKESAASRAATLVRLKLRRKPSCKDWELKDPSMTFRVPQPPVNDKTLRRCVSAGHMVLCEILNAFPLNLTRFDDATRELPGEDLLLGIQARSLFHAPRRLSEKIPGGAMCLEGLQNLV